MLNYIWGGLLIISLIVAIGNDSYDILNNTYKNGEVHQVELRFPLEGNENKTLQKVWIRYSPCDSVIASLRTSSEKQELVLTDLKKAPTHWQLIFSHLPEKIQQKGLPLRVDSITKVGNLAIASITLPEIKFVKLKAIADAAFDMASFSVELAIGLIGAMALWLGLMQIADKSGLIFIVVKFVRPVMKYLFPNVPSSHPALGAISLNLAANMLGLGNAATPLGIKAMEELQKLNPDKETATDAMCMFATINTASVQLVPPVTLVAIMGVGIAELFFSIILATLISLVVGIIAAKYFARNDKNPNLSTPDAQVS